MEYEKLAKAMVFHSLEVLPASFLCYPLFLFFGPFRMTTWSTRSLPKPWCSTSRRSPGERTKTAEEVAEAEKTRLEKLEVRYASRCCTVGCAVQRQFCTVQLWYCAVCTISHVYSTVQCWRGPVASSMGCLERLYQWTERVAATWCLLVAGVVGVAAWHRRRGGRG